MSYLIFFTFVLVCCTWYAIERAHMEQRDREREDHRHLMREIRRHEREDEYDL